MNLLNILLPNQKTMFLIKNMFFNKVSHKFTQYFTPKSKKHVFLIKNMFFIKVSHVFTQYFTPKSKKHEF